MMENKIEQVCDRLKINHGIFDFFPVILDYDFEKKRPRGLSSRVDFFSYGAISDVLDGIDLMPYVFIKKKHTFFENGMILADFSKIAKNPSDFVSMIKKLKATKIYLEESKYFSLNDAIKKLKNVSIVLMEV